MGAGHCPWGGYTDQIVCNIHGDGTPRIALSHNALACKDRHAVINVHPSAKNHVDDRKNHRPLLWILLMILNMLTLTKDVLVNPC